MRYTLYSDNQYWRYWSPQPGYIIHFDKSRGKFIDQNNEEIRFDPRPYKDGIYVGQHNRENFLHAIVPESHPAFNLILMHSIGSYCIPNDLSKREELYNVPTIVLNNALI